MDPKKFYNERMPEKLGPDYESARWHSTPFQEAQYGMMSQVMRRFVMPIAQEAGRILEVGPGAGTWTRFLFQANKSADYTLLDISAEMLARAQTSLPHGFAVSMAEGDFLAYESQEPFDLIFSSRALEYMPDKAALARKIAPLLARDGTAILITKMPKALSDTLSGRKLSELHQGQIGPQALGALLEKAGLRVVKLRMATATVPVFRSPSLNHLAFWLFSRIPLVWPITLFAESYVLIAKKNS